MEDKTRAAYVFLHRLAQGAGQREAGCYDVELGLHDCPDHPAGLSVGGAPDGLYGDLHGFAIPLQVDSDGLAAAGPDDLMETYRGVDGMAAGAKDQIALLQSH